MAKLFVILSAFLAATLAEPPVSSYLPPGRGGASGAGRNGISNSYLPPSNSLDSYNSNGGAGGYPSQLSNTYGAPFQNQGRDDFSDTVTIEAASRSGQLSSTYGAPSRNGHGSFAGGRSAQPSSTYGAPQGSFRSGSGFGAQPSSTYGAPQSSFRSGSGFGSLPSSTYGAPQSSFRSGSGFGAQPSSTYGAPQGSFKSGSGSGFGSQPSSTYGAPQGSFRSGSGFGAQPSSTYGAPEGSFRSSSGFGFGTQPSSTYGAPGSQAAGRFTAAIPSNSYGTPFNSALDNTYAAPNSLYSAPSNSYSAPLSGQSSNGYSRQLSSEYGAPGYGKKTTTEDPLAEPANYEYRYEVKDEETYTGTEFGHQESRENESARGVYHVLLPDGRMQIVEYEADEEGYRPRIRYEETGYPDARNGQNGQGGY